MPVIIGDTLRQACQSSTSLRGVICTAAAQSSSSFRRAPLPGRRRGRPPATREVVGRVLEEKYWGRMMLFVIGDSVEASVSKWHLLERCNLCVMCSVPATFLPRMHRFQYNAATEIDDNDSLSCMFFCLYLQILSLCCAGDSLCLFYVLARKRREQDFWRSMENAPDIQELQSISEFLYVTQ